MSEAQIFVGLGLIIGLAVGCQIVAAKLAIPAIILLLPVGFAAGNLITAVDPEKLLGAAFPPLVSLAVAIILFDGGLDLVRGNLTAMTTGSSSACAGSASRSPGSAGPCSPGCCSDCRRRLRSCSVRS